MSENSWVAETRAIEIRNLTDSEGTFEGRACTYGVIDKHGTTFEPGCFTRGGLETSTYALLWMHDITQPVGVFTAQERTDGLYIQGRWDDSKAGQDARAAALSGSAAELSVGFAWADDGSGVISEARLMEVSQVTSRFASVPGSVLTAVRMASIVEDIRAGRILSSDNEKALRDAYAAIGTVLDKLGERTDEVEVEARIEDTETQETEEDTRCCDCCSCGACSVDLSTEADEEERSLIPAHIALVARARLL